MAEEIAVIVDDSQETVVINVTSPSDAVDSVFGRTGVVVAVTNDYDADQIDDTSTANKFTTATEISKLAGIQTGAEVNPDLISQAEAEAGTATTERIWSSLRVKQAIEALGSGGATVPIARTGVSIAFDVPAVYNEITPASTAITLDTTGQVAGITQGIYHKGLTVPTFTTPFGKKLYFNGFEYVNDDISLNIIFITSTPEGNYLATVKSYDGYIGDIDYETELDTIITAAGIAGDPTPVNTTLEKVSNFITGLKSLRDDADTVNTDIFARFDCLQVYMKEGEQFSKYDLITGTKDAAAISGMAYELAKGWRGAAGDALDVNGATLDVFTTNYVQDDACVIAYVQESTDGYVFGALNAAASIRTQLGYGSGSGKYQWALNGGSVAGYTLASTDGLHALDRSSSANFKVYINGALETTATSASVGIPDTEMYAGARNFLGVNTPMDGVIGFLAFGASIDGYHASFNTLFNDTILS